MLMAVNSGLKGSGIRFTLIVGILAVRFVLLPLLGIVIVKSAVQFGLVHSDPLYQFILLLQFAVPPAMNIGMVNFEDDLGRIKSSAF